MKAATGELQLTVITLIAIAAVIGFFWFAWEPIQETIKGQWDNVQSANSTDGSQGDQQQTEWNQH